MASRAQLIAMTMTGSVSCTTYAPQRIAALLAFPSNGAPMRATVRMRWSDYNRLKVDGLVAGPTHSAHLTPLGVEVCALLQRGVDPDLETGCADDWFPVAQAIEAGTGETAETGSTAKPRKRGPKGAPKTSRKTPPE